MGSMRSVWEAWKVKGNCMGSLLEVLEGNRKDGKVYEKYRKYRGRMCYTSHAPCIKSS